MNYVVTANVLARLSGRTVRAVHQRAAKEGWLYREVKGLGGTRKEFFVASLPGEFQNLAIESIKSQGAGPLRLNCGDAGGILPPATPAPEAGQTLPAWTIPLKDGCAHHGGYSEPSGNGAQAEVVNLPAVLPAVRPPATVSRILNLPDAAVGAGAWASLPEAQKESGFTILNIVNSARDVYARAKKGKVKKLKSFAEREGISYPTLRRHMKAADDALLKARKAGEDTIFAQVKALTYKYGNNRGVVRAFDETAVKFAFVNYCTQKHLNLSDVYDNLTSVALSEGWKVGSYEQLCRIIAKMDAATRDRARKGNHHFEDKRLVKILRNYDEIPPNFMWCGDHHIFDVFTKLPDGAGGFTYMRPWITCWLDLASRSLMGWCISFNPNSRCIAMALAHGIADKGDPDFPQCGLPGSVYIDNGKDYRAKYLRGEKVMISGDGKIDYPEMMEKFASLGIDPFYIDLEYDAEEDAWVKRRGQKEITVKGVRVGGVYSKLGIAQRYATAYHPWAKPIERFFGTVVRSFSRSLPGWCGSGPDERPEKLKWELKSGQVLTIQEFCETWHGFVTQKYHKDPHAGHGMNGMSPDQAFLSRLPKPVAVEPALLDFALMKKDRVRMYNWGFNLNGRQFEPVLPTNLYGGYLANQVIGEWVTVLFDYDYKTIRVYKNGGYMCDARALRRASFIAGDDDVQVEKLKVQAYQKQATNRILSVVRADEPRAAAPVTEAQALLMLSREAETGDEAAAGRRPAPLPNAADDDVIAITRDERYRQVLKKMASGRDLTEKDKVFKDDFEASSEYEDGRELYEIELEYLKHKSGGGN